MLYYISQVPVSVYRLEKALIPLDEYDEITRPTKGIIPYSDLRFDPAVLFIVDKNLAIVADSLFTTKIMELKENNVPIEKFRAPFKFTTYYSNFLLTGLTTAQGDYFQLIETFNANFLNVTRQRPEVLNGTGILLNTFDFPWKELWIKNWDKVLHPKNLVSSRQHVVLATPTVIYHGYFLNYNISETAEQESIVPFNFEFFVLYKDFTKFDEWAPPIKLPEKPKKKESKLIKAKLIINFTKALALLVAKLSEITASGKGEAWLGLPNILEQVVNSVMDLMEYDNEISEGGREEVNKIMLAIGIGSAVLMNNITTIINNASKDAAEALYFMAIDSIIDILEATKRIFGLFTEEKFTSDETYYQYSYTIRKLTEDKQPSFPQASMNMTSGSLQTAINVLDGVIAGLKALHEVSSAVSAAAHTIT
jgi:hypothetical protein